MASAVTHAFSSLILGKTFLQEKMSWRFWALLTVCSILPDVDVLGFSLGWAYGHTLGHRGFTHSLFFAFLLSLLVVSCGVKDNPKFSKAWWKLCLLCFLIISTHGLLDAMTDGGLGVAFLSPFTAHRYFLPWTPLKISPLGVEAFFSPWGREVIINELKWVWMPTLLLLGAVKGYRKFRSLKKRAARQVLCLINQRKG